ncbi:hypothetical protein ACFVFS_09380 [Kitasatospora sp. NPDC057692]|uniref:hypothetical protein n=1 Tax=Kitasatospora sp. NPDC057692 TaxID=3346215 RepID=UPI003680F48B
MSATCPQCSAPDQSVAVPHALAPTAQPPLDEAARAQLVPPPAPQPGRLRLNGGTITFYALTGVLTLLAVLSLFGNHDADLDGAEPAYVAGYLIGPFLFPLLFLLIAVVLHAVSRKGQHRRLAETLPAQQALWQRHHFVWQSAWLCRRCRVAFFPAAALRPDVAASPPIPLDQFPLWVVTASDRTYGFPTPPVAPN